MTDKSREELVQEVIAAREKYDALNVELEQHDHANKVLKSMSYVGRAFKRVNTHYNEKEHITCVFINGIDNTNQNPHGLQVSYYFDKGTWYEVTYNHRFSEVNYEGEKEWEEISVDKFKDHYYKVMAIIKKGLYTEQ